MIRLIVSALIVMFLTTGQAAAAADFSSWLQSLKQEALDKGISPRIVDGSLSNITPIARIIELDRKQPESTLSFARYKEKVITADRINTGRALFRKHRPELEKIAKNYGVPAQYIVALWGIETSYGNNTGGFGVIPALATLAYDGRRSSYFRGELISALQILDQGHIAPEDMKGSWAGAMGQNQFMPSSFKAYAVDGNGDGRRDIWTTLTDVFASTANYLRQSGWDDKQRWGREVSLPEKFPKNLAGLDNKKPLSEWNSLGITLPDSQPLPVSEDVKASIVLPDGINGPAFLVYDNYRVIMKWNKSVYFATSVGLLADRIAQ